MCEETLTLADVVGSPLITFTRNSRAHTTVLAPFSERGLRPSTVHCITSMAAIARLTQRGLGIATLPLASDLSGPELFSTNVYAQLPLLPLYCIWRRSSDAASYKAIADLARACAERHQRLAQRPVGHH